MVAVYVENLAEVRRSLKQYEPQLLPVLRAYVKGAIDTTTVEYIRGRVPNKDGDALGSIRSTAGGNSFYVKAGNAQAPYFGWLDFGGQLKATGKRRNTQNRPIVKGGRYVYPGAMQSMPELGRAVQSAVNKTTDKFNNS